jgi:hypothetical protein
MHPCKSFSAIAAWLCAMPAAILLFLPAAQAMVVVERDFPDLVQRAEQIVSGTVADVSETQRPSGAPVTLVTVDDLTVMKGEARGSMTLEFYGGTVGEYAIKVPDMPTFAVGERVVLFVAGNGVNVCPLVGVWQGSFRILTADGGATDVVATNGGQPLAAAAGAQLRPLRDGGDGGGAAAALTLDQFRDLIADELANPSRDPR